ncbi:MAG: TetR/AcrR family transcriptional regulator [Lachnospiraceae bacterium]|jgi:AcrR family transcriptional regulator|nr:TetR/AcrR family transcriptional regulator [Lachnospiraceae bacterium]
MSVRDTSIDPRLMDSAREEFLKNGFIKSDLKTICDKAGVTTGAVYKRYKGKEELFSAVVSDVVSALNTFLENRAKIDLSILTDDEIKDSWKMSYDSMLPMFRMLRSYGDDFKILIDKSSGTKFENFSHDYVIKMSYAYEQFYKEAYKRGIASEKVSRDEFHILLTSFWSSICEPFVHDMSEKQMEEHCLMMCRFFDWAAVVGME